MNNKRSAVNFFTQPKESNFLPHYTCRTINHPLFHFVTECFCSCAISGLDFLLPFIDL